MSLNIGAYCCTSLQHACPTLSLPFHGAVYLSASLSVEKEQYKDFLKIIWTYVIFLINVSVNKNLHAQLKYTQLEFAF